MNEIPKKVTTGDLKRYYPADTVDNIFAERNGRVYLDKRPNVSLRLNRPYATSEYRHKPHIIYWIRQKEHDNPITQGYIGMCTATNICQRIHYHRKSGTPDVQNAIRSGKGVIEIMHILSNRKKADEVEELYRKSENRGWNEYKRESTSLSKDVSRGDENFSGYNKPKHTPKHPTKSHAVLARSEGKTKLIRFGQQGVSGEGKPAESDSKADKARRASFKARHAKNIKRGKLSAAYWADKVKW